MTERVSNPVLELGNIAEVPVGAEEEGRADGQVKWKGSRSD